MRIIHLANSLTNIRNLHNLSYPVFKIPTIELEEVDGLLFGEGRIIDDRNVNAETLGERRLRTPMKPLMRLRKVAFEPRDVIYFGGNRYYIDRLGKVWYYEKTVYCKLKYYKIQSKVFKETKTVIKLYGIKNRFTLKRPPPRGFFWVGVLHLNNTPWTIYNFSKTKLKDSRRKV